MDLKLNTSPPNCPKDSWKLLPLLISINWPSMVTQLVVVQKIYWKIHPASCNNIYHDVIDLVNHSGMVKNTKTWMSWQWNITFLQNKKKINICLRWNILKNYCFVAEVTFTDALSSAVFKEVDDLISHYLYKNLPKKLCQLQEEVEIYQESNEFAEDSFKQRKGLKLY